MAGNEKVDVLIIGVRRLGRRGGLEPGRHQDAHPAAWSRATG